MARIFKYTAESLLFTFNEYKEWIKTQGYLQRIVLKNGELKEYEVPKPMSVESFCFFADITPKTFYSYIKENEGANEVDSDEELTERTELLNSATRIRDEIRDYRIGGATVNVFNASVVAKTEGLREVMEVEHTGAKEVINININNKEADLT